jgi:hypothetical protein
MDNDRPRPNKLQGVAQLLARGIWNPEVASSSLATLTNSAGDAGSIIQCGVEKWSSRLAHNQQIVGANPTVRNQP